jgi:hypothetical protein
MDDWSWTGVHKTARQLRVLRELGANRILIRLW